MQEAFGTLSNVGDRVARDDGQFYHLVVDGERHMLGKIEAMAIHVPNPALHA